jgi:Uma2 family endonuclease
LSREEFERRYDAMPNLKKAELIDGVVYMPSPVRLDHHGEPHLDLGTWLGIYKWATPGVRGGDNTTARLDELNDAQPDLMLLIKPECGGQSRVSSDGYLEEAPEFVAEVASSSASYDLHDKLEAYRKSGVREYLVWRVLDQAVDWFRLHKKRFETVAPAKNGILRSTAFPGLWLDPDALVRGDTDQLMAVIQQGLASPEHAAFVEQLQNAREG